MVTRVLGCRLLTFDAAVRRAEPSKVVLEEMLPAPDQTDHSAVSMLTLLLYKQAATSCFHHWLDCCAAEAAEAAPPPQRLLIRSSHFSGQITLNGAFQDGCEVS